MTHTEIVKKLIGPIEPLGDASRDDERLNNLKAMCDLVNDLVTAIDNVAYRNRNSHESSVQKAAYYAYAFLTETLGITGD